MLILFTYSSRKPVYTVANVYQAVYNNDDNNNNKTAELSQR